MASRRFADAAIGHRGAGWHWPENTILALRVAMQAGLRASEVDVRVSRDTVPVLMHDATVDRTTTGRGSVEDFTAAQLIDLDAGSRFGPQFGGERVPTLEQALVATASNRYPLVLDIKPQSVTSSAVEADLLAAIVERLAAAERVYLFSDDTTFLIAARQRSPTVGLLLAAHRYRPWQRAFAARLNVRTVLYHPSALASYTSDWPALDSLEADSVHVVASTTNDLLLADSILSATSVRRMLTDRPPAVFEVLRLAGPSSAFMTRSPR